MAAPAYQLQPPRKKSRKVLWVIIAVVVIVIVIVVAIMAYDVVNTVHITGEDWTIDYSGVSSGYFGPSPQSSADSMTGMTGSSFTYTFSITSSAALLTHNISSITIASPFSLTSVSPSLPITVSPGGVAGITLTITMP